MNVFLFMILSFFTRTTSTIGTLTVTLVNFRNDQGQTGVALYNKEEAFPKHSNKAVKSVFAPIRDKKAVVVFDDLPAGEYAISVFHDENKNGKMDTNFLGIPKEGVGASNNARGHWGPPSYQDAKFSFNGGVQSIIINMVYL